MIRGYKVFNKDFTNRYGKKFEVGQTYSADGQVKFAAAHGIHFCTNLEDVFRYFDAVEDEVTVAEVSTEDCGENLVKYDEEYNGYYDMYACKTIKIERVLTREEIFEMIMKKGEISIRKFLATYKLNEEEREKFLRMNTNKFLNGIFEYYQNKNTSYFK